MNMPKATEILTQLSRPGIAVSDQDDIDAIKLGIEAFKEITCLRSSDRTQVRPLLPGETPHADSP